MEIVEATSDREVQACFGVMAELRPHLQADGWLERVRSQQRPESGGYRLIALYDEGEVRAVAGFRIGQNLAWGRFLYVDDLATASSARSRGYGSALLAWLRQCALAEGCAQLHLDSGVQRLDAHRFYDREGMQRTSLHFAQTLEKTLAG